MRPQPVHPSITAEQIDQLVEQFYASLLRDERMAELFATNTSGEWPDHLRKMKTFWRSVLLKSAEYKGKPVPAHQKIPGLEGDDFQHWLTTFAGTCNSVFAPAAAPLVVEAAKRIATSLWLSRQSDPFSQPPKWA